VFSPDFFHIASVYPKSTECIIQNIKKHHFYNYYFLAIDGRRLEFQKMAEDNKCDYVIYDNPLGGPVPPIGYDLDKTLRFLERFKTACLNATSPYMMMVEDDVLIIKPITIDESWEHACADTKIGNHIPETVIEMIEIHCGKRPTFTQYGAGGGSIFKVSTFLEHYDSNIAWFKKYFEMIQMVYPTIGYIDCFMNVYYWLAGKDYSVNTHRADTHNHKPGFDYETFISNQPPEIQIINNYKKYYYE
jgi:hypothetical protein